MQLPSRASAALAVAIVSMSAAITGVAVDSLSSRDLDLGTGVFTRVGDTDSTPLIGNGQVPPPAPLEYGLPDVNQFLPLAQPSPAPVPARTDPGSADAPPASGRAPGSLDVPQAAAIPPVGRPVARASQGSGTSGAARADDAGQSAGGSSGRPHAGGSGGSGSGGSGGDIKGESGSGGTQPGGMATRPAPKPEPTQVAPAPTRTKGNATSQSKANPNSQRVPGQDKKNASPKP